MRKSSRPRPQHPFPFIASGSASPACSSRHIHPSTPRQKTLLSLIRAGARVLFDIKEKRALIYTWEGGFTKIFEITVRVLGSLIRSGKVVRVGQDSNLVHFAYVGTSTAWYDPE